MSMVRAATRSSPLARWQTEYIASLIHTCTDHVVDFVYVDTLGDRTQALGTPLHQLGGQGVFVKEVQAAVLGGDADIAVHSAKDLPSQTADGLVLAGIATRGDVRDVLIGGTLDSLRKGATVGTSSVRRAAQLLALRPDLEIRTIRGNVGTRIARVGELDAVVLAAAPLTRLSILEAVLDRHVVEWLDTERMLPMVGQGAIAVECRAGDDPTAGLLSAITNETSAREVKAERAFLERLGGGCDLPVGALAVCLNGSASISMEALVASFDGVTIIRRSGTGDDPAILGSALAAEILDAGGLALLART